LSDISVMIRKARLEDEPYIREFTRHTFHFGDYVADALPGWLEEGCDVWVADVGGIPVGVVCTGYPAPGEAWFQGMRVHPEYRRQGIATALTQACIKGAQARGARVARVIIDSDNYRSIGLASSIGFRQVAQLIEFDVYPELLIPHGPLPHGPELVITKLEPHRAEEAWELAKEDIRYIGTCYGEWVFLSPGNLRSMAERGYMLVAHTPSGKISAGALLDDWYQDDYTQHSLPELEQEITSFFGSLEGIRALIHHAAKALCEEAARRGDILCRLRPSAEDQSPALEMLRQIAKIEQTRWEAARGRAEGKSPADDTLASGVALEGKLSSRVALEGEPTSGIKPTEKHKPIPLTKRQGPPIVETGDVMLLWEYPLDGTD